MEAHTRFREPLLGWIPMFEYTMLALKCLFGPYTRDLGVAVEKFGDFTYPIVGVSINWIVTFSMP